MKILEMAGAALIAAGTALAEADATTLVLGACALRALDVSNNCLTGVTGHRLGTHNNEGIDKLADGLPGSTVRGAARRRSVRLG